MSKASCGTRLPVPFIVGTGRSGTTLLRLMLDAHPQLAIPPESLFLVDLVCHSRPLSPILRALTRLRLGRLKNYCEAAVSRSPFASHMNARTFLNIVTTHRLFADFHVDAEALKSAVEGLRPFGVADAVRLLYSMYAARFDKNRWGDKTPAYLLYMDPLQRLLPEARFIHIIRDGRDVALSLKATWFGPQAATEVARWWLQRLRFARWQARRLRHYMEIRYEDLVEQPEVVLQRLCAFVELPWEPVMLDYHTRAQERLKEMNDVVQPEGSITSREMRLGLHVNTSSPPQRNRVARWRREMSDADQRQFDRVAGKALRELGYE